MQEENQESMAEAALYEYKRGLGTFTQKMPKLAGHFNAFTEECFAEGTLSKKQKQLIALGISLSSQDEYCIIYHLKGCVDQGASEEEILETVGVSAAFGGGGAVSQAVTLVLEVLDDFKAGQ